MRSEPPTTKGSTKMAKHIMIDLETLGTEPYSVILSLGAAVFDPYAGIGSAGKRADIQHSFEINIDPISSQKAGLRIDASTTAWWFNPERDEPRRVWFNTLKFELPLALDGFDMWLNEIGIPKDERVIWGNGSDFDNVLLANAYKVAGREAPWNHWNNRCFRTLKNLSGDNDLRPDHKRVAHTALGDAIYQALWAGEIVRHHGIQL